MVDRSPTDVFSDRADDYARFRPSYPLEAVDHVLQDLATPTALDVADIGAGTGILARLLADRGCRVVAVEPNAAMAGAASLHPRVRWVNGTAEHTGLAAGSVDATTIAQAFHWFEAQDAVREFGRILRPGGRLAILWNRRSRDDEFTRGYRAALDAIDAEAPAERTAFDPQVVTSVGGFANHRFRTFDHSQPMTADQLVGRAFSTSTVPRSGARAERLLAMLRDLHGRHARADGRAIMVHRTEVHLWDAAP